jgi:hypothetical protein
MKERLEFIKIDYDLHFFGWKILGEPTLTQVVENDVAQGH